MSLQPKCGQPLLEKAIDHFQKSLLLSNTPNSKNEEMKKWRLCLATKSERSEIRDFHIHNHLKETVRFPGEEKAQTGDLEKDFPFLYNDCAFSEGWMFVVREDDSLGQPGKIVACIGLQKKSKACSEQTTCCNSQLSKATDETTCSQDPNKHGDVTVDTVYDRIVWLQGFSIAAQHRGKGMGGRLLDFVLSLNDIFGFDTVRLVTLGKHSEDTFDIMGAARRLYERRGFKLYKEVRVEKFGDNTSLSVLWYQCHCVQGGAQK